MGQRDDDPGKDPGGRLDDDPGAGGAGGDPDDDPDDGGDDDGDDEDEEYTPPTREEWAKLQRIAAARKIERNEARVELRSLRAAAAGAGKDAGDAKDTAKDEETDRWRTTAARSSAATQLSAAGFSGTAKQARKLTRLLDLAGAEPDSDGDFDFEDDIEDLKIEFPQLFAPPADGVAGRPAARPTTADRGRRTPRDAGDDPTQRTSDRLLRSAGVRPARRP
jgi:hypothetical protein